MFWVISVYFNIRNTLPKSRTFLLLNPVYLLKSTLDKLYSNSIKLIICGDVNINYLKDSNYKTKLNFLLTTYNLHSEDDFPTRITERSSTAVDNIFLNKETNLNYFVEPLTNGLSDHDAQLTLQRGVTGTARIQ